MARIPTKVSNAGSVKKGIGLSIGYEFIPERTIVENFRRMREYNLNRLAIEAAYAAEQIAAEMKANHPWTDRTGRATKGLFATGSRNGEKIILAAGFDDTVVNPRDGATYGGILETWEELGGKYAIVDKTVKGWRQYLIVVQDDFISDNNRVVKKGKGRKR